MQPTEILGRVVAGLVAVLGTAGYVMVLGGAVLWLRLRDADLPMEVPVSLARREELIAMGAQAIAVWMLLAAGLALLAGWLITGERAGRRFRPPDALLALSTTVAISLALSVESSLVEIALIVVAATAPMLVLAVGLRTRARGDSIAAALVPTLVGIGIALALPTLTDESGLTTVVSTWVIFGLVMLATPKLQRRYSRRDANEAALAWLETSGAVPRPGEELPDVGQPLQRAPGAQVADALRRRLSPPSVGPLHVSRNVLVWTAVGGIGLVLLAFVAVSSQLDRDNDFRAALVSLDGGGCLLGTYVARGEDQVILGDRRADGSESTILVVPLDGIADVRVGGERRHGIAVERMDRAACEKASESWPVR